MKTKFTISEDKCTSHGLSVEEFLVALMYRQIRDPNSVITSLMAKEVIVLKDGKVYVTQSWSDTINEILAESAIDVDISEERLTNLAKRLRDIYPSGKMKNRFGEDTPYYYRGNTGEVKRHLKRFFATYGNYSDEDIVAATQSYVDAYGENFTGRLLKYFIIKDDKQMSEDGSMRVNQLSDLATILENPMAEKSKAKTDWFYKISE